MRRHLHSLSHYNLFTCDQGYLVPIAAIETLPGDTFQHQTSLLIRTTPLVAPLMHPVHARVHHWFVPYRLIWEDFESFITGGEDGLDTSTFPTIDFSGSAVAEGDLADYLGLPIGFNGEASALPFRAYNLIYNEWYRDQQLQTEKGLDITSGADTTTDTDLLSPCWEKDNFTAARASEQLGAEVSLPLGIDAPVTGIGIGNQTYGDASQNVYETDGTGTTAYADNTGPIQTHGSVYIEEDPDNAGFPNIRADLQNATAATINQLREAFALQKFAEWRNLYGGRYTEYLRADFGTRSSDARLQRPEYLAGGKQTLQFSEVLQTAPSIDDTSAESVGALKGHGISAMRSNKYRRFFEEHGIVISFLSVKPKTIYHQGVEKMWLKTTKEQFWNRHLEGLGSQEIENQEVYFAHASPTATFGYEDRYDEYRRVKSRVTGEFHDTLDYWHMARDFASDPALNSSFVTANPTDRVYAATGPHELQIMGQHSIQARRLVSKRARRSSLV
jgi:hypothetical protein